MKRYIIYLILSVLLIVPIAAIITIAVINQPVNNYTSYQAVYDYSAVETREVVIKDISEVIKCYGTLTTSQMNYYTIKYKYRDTLIITAKAGDYVTNEDVLVIKNGENLLSKIEGKIEDITDNGSIIICLIKSPNVDTLKINIPSQYYPYVENSFAFFNIAGTEYKAEFLKKVPAADSINNTFIASYSITGDNLLLDAQIEVYLTTGNIRKDVYVVPKACIYKDEFGKYYIETIIDESKVSIYVNIGLMNQMEVEITQTDNGQNMLYEGLPVTVNEKDVFKDNKDLNLSDENQA